MYEVYVSMDGKKPKFVGKIAVKDRAKVARALLEIAHPEMPAVYMKHPEWGTLQCTRGGKYINMKKSNLPLP